MMHGGSSDVRCRQNTYGALLSFAHETMKRQSQGISGYPIRIWLYALSTSVSVPLILILAALLFAQWQQSRETARDTSLTIARTTAEAISADQAEAERLLGRLAERLESRPSDSPCDPLLDFVELFPQYVGMILYRPEGDPICSSFEGAIDAGPALIDRLTNEAPLTPHLLRLESGSSFLTFSREVTIRQSAAVLSLILRFQIDESSLPAGAVLTIIDDGGTVIARTIDPETWVGRISPGTGLTEIILREREGRIEARGMDAVRRQYGFTHLPSFGWSIYVGVPDDAVMTPVRDQAVRAMVLGLIVIAIVFVLARNLSRRIESPIGQLATATREAADSAGGTVAIPEISGPREIVELASTLKATMETRDHYERRLQEDERQLRALSDRLLKIQEEERRRIAREIHDDLGQTITALKMDVGGMLALLETNQSEVRRLGARVTEAADSLVEDVQRITSELRPSALDDLDLTAALELETRLFEERTGIECELSIHPPDLQAAESIETTIYRIIQEALTNVSRHAVASRVEVRLRRREDEIVLEIRDDGRGIRPDRIGAPEALGLIGIRERASMMGGEAMIEGVPGRGTIVSVKLPVESSE